MYLLLVFLPFFGFLLVTLFGRFFGLRGAPLVTTFSVMTSCFLSFCALYEVGVCGSPCYVQFLPWFQTEMFVASWGFMFDSLTVIMCVVVTFVSSLVHIYSISYMGEDPHLPRFMSYLSVFTFFMLMLVTSDNFLQMFFGWEGVGVASYLLINFWFTRLQANKSAIKAMLVNRVGDFGLALGIMAIFHVFKAVDFETVFACASMFADHHLLFFHFEVHTITCISLLLFIGAVGKSAQLGLHTWLPDAMEGPTPVSALIHAATMVTAGVFLLARCSPLLEYSAQALVIITLLGASTAFFAATTGVVQNDLKRVIAYSTCSQLGYMMFACGISQYAVGVFHLMNHAFFKALLFLSAGSVIHALGDEQDMRKMGGLVRLLPFTYSMMVLGSLALVGFPYLTGFYSKDVILEVAYAKYTLSGNFAYWLGTVSALLTSYYSFRLLYLTFLASPQMLKSSVTNVHDAPFLMGFSLCCLAFGSIFGGFLTKDMMIGLGTNFWGTALFTLPKNTLIVESEYIPQAIKFIPIIFSLLGALFAVNFNGFGSAFSYFLKTSTVGKQVYIFLNKRWLFDKVYNDFLASPSLNFGYTTSFQLIDKGFLEAFGPTGVIQQSFFMRKFMKQLHTGSVYQYAFMMFLSLTILLAFLVIATTNLAAFLDGRLLFILLLSFFWLADK